MIYHCPLHHWPRATLTALLEPTYEWLKVATFKVLAKFNRCISLTQINLAIILTYVTYVTEIWEQMAYGQFSMFPKVRQKEIRTGNLQFTKWNQ